MKRFGTILVVSAFGLLIGEPARAAKNGPTTITFSPANPLPGDTVTVTINGGWCPVCGPKYVTTSILDRVIRLQSFGPECNSNCITICGPYTLTTTLQIPNESARAGTYSVEYYTVDFDHVIRLDTTQSLTVAALQGTCTPGATTLCLGAHRFQASARWRTSNGSSGDARAVPLTDGSGYFWFFNADNPELTIKVLNGCSMPSPAFWTFASGLTNVQVDLTVIDTKTGAVRTYSNPQGKDFAPIFDTSAFATCP